MAPHSSTLAWRIQWTEEPVGCSPWGCQESDTTERLHFHFSLSCIGEGNGNPLQYSCLENPRDGGAWWAAVYGVAQSQTRVKRLSSSSSSKASLYCSFSQRYFLQPLHSPVSDQGPCVLQLPSKSAKLLCTASAVVECSQRKCIQPCATSGVANFKNQYFSFKEHIFKSC